jgi:hypothetical protein
MNYLLDTLEYLPTIIEEDLLPIVNINCSDDKNEKFYYNLNIDMDGSIVGEMTFTRKNDLVFIRESTITDDYLVEEAMDNINNLFPDCRIFDISSATDIITD